MEVLLVIAAYILGSLPFGFWITKLFKGLNFDIRDWGSNNIGFTNVKRVLGWKAGLPVLFADVAKSFVPVLLAHLYFGAGEEIACLLAAVFGHARSIYFYMTEGKFSGGKSVATAFGGLIAAQPLIAGLVLGCFLVILLTTRYLSLASILASFCAFGLAVAFHKGPVWTITLGIVAFFLIYTHRRNIGQLLGGVEPKFNERRGAHGQGGEAVVCFVIHSLTLDDLSQSPQSNWISWALEKKVISRRMARAIIARSPAIKFFETQVIDRMGEKVRLIILGIPLLPDQIMDPTKKQLIEQLLRASAVLAQRMGATVIGLGALLSSVAGGGVELQRWARQERKLSITVDNGGAFTAAATVQALKTTLDAKNAKLEELTVAVVGAAGVIGTAIVNALVNTPAKLIVCGRSMGKLGRFRDVATIEPLPTSEGIRNADVVILTTSSTDPIIDSSNIQTLKQGAVVLDVAVPPDFDDRALGLRQDIILIRSGLIAPPGDFQIELDFHFGSIQSGTGRKKLIPACAAQALILGLTQRYDLASRGARIRLETMDWFLEEATKRGFEVVVSPISEPTVFGKGSAL